jgi:hypothetical protein
MAKATYIYACGHGTGSVDGHNRAAAERRAEWMGNHQHCWACEKAARADAAARASDESGLQPLTGTPKQIAWANRLRAEAVESIDYTIKVLRGRVAQENEALLAELDDALKLVVTETVARTDARYWIDDGAHALRDSGRLLKHLLSRGLLPGLAAAHQARSDV